MTKLASIILFLLSQMATAQNLAKEELLDNPRICRIEKTNFSNLQIGNISSGALSENVDPRLVRLRSYTDRPDFAFVNNKGIKISHSLNVIQKPQVAATTNSLSHVGTNENAKVTVNFKVQGATVLVRLTYEIKNKRNVIISAHFFEASCSLPQ